MNTKTIKINFQEFVMHSSGVLFWEQKSLLLISDVHLGKISHFRKYGAAVPQKAIAKNFELLEEVVTFFQPKNICFLGDLFHSSINQEWHPFKNWVSGIGAQIILVKGNHDIISCAKYEALGIEVVPELPVDTFLLTHHPEDREGFYNLSGHIHPAVRLRGYGRQSLRLPCFFKRKNHMILPAFGEFTGSHVLKAQNDDEIYAITENEVLLVSKSKVC